MSEVYDIDTVLAGTRDVEPLARVRDIELSHRYVDRIRFMPTLGLFGTAGDPELITDWRLGFIDKIRDDFDASGVGHDADVYNPVKLEWKPEDAAEESLHLARDVATVLPVLDRTTGHASLAETGFAAMSGVLRQQKVHLYIESGYEFDDSVQSARTLTTLLARKTLKDFPINVSLARDLDDLVSGGTRDVADYVHQVESRVMRSTNYVIKRRTDLRPKIALVGSGAPAYSESWHRGMERLLKNNDVASQDQYSAYVKDWSIDDAFTELDHKTNDAVVLFVVNETENSYGAMGELGWLFTYCMLNGQKLGLYVEQHDSEPKSDQNRQRKLAMAHLGRCLLDFPDLPVFIAQSPAELARFGATELAKYKQFQQTYSAAVATH
jgi:hypothetical protein